MPPRAATHLPSLAILAISVAAIPSAPAQTCAPMVLDSIGEPVLHVNDIDVRNGLAYVSEDSNGLVILDISDPLSIAVVGMYPTARPPGAIACDGDVAYIYHRAWLDPDIGGFRPSTVSVIDVQDPAHPTLLTTLEDPDSFRPIAIRDGRLMAYGGGGLQFLNISNPLSPSVIGSLELENYGPMALSGDWAYTSTYTGMLTIDISDPADPRLVDDDGPFYFPDSIAISNKVAYALSDLQAAPGTILYALSLSDPSNPQLIDPFGTGLGVVDACGVARDDRLYLVEPHGGVEILRVTDPTDPSRVGTIISPRDGDNLPYTPTGLFYQDMLVVATRGRGVYLANVLSCQCRADVSTTESNPGDPGFGEPDGAINGADLSYLVEQWLFGRPVADLTTSDTNPADPLFGLPDGLVNGADLSYFVEVWLAGCG